MVYLQRNTSPRCLLTLCDGGGAALYAGHGEEEDGVGVGAARGVFAHPLLRLQRLAPGDQENLQQPRGDFRFRRQGMMKYPYFTVPGVC